MRTGGERYCYEKKKFKVGLHRDRSNGSWFWVSMAIESSNGATYVFKKLKVDC